jgi:hypothetical protein
MISVKPLCCSALQRVEMHLTLPMTLQFRSTARIMIMKGIRQLQQNPSAKLNPRYLYTFLILILTFSEVNLSCEIFVSLVYSKQR